MSTERSIPKYLLCGCLTDVSPAKVPLFLSSSSIDMVEWRFDVFIRANSLDVALESLSILSSPSRHPVIATNRPTWEGGDFDRDEDLRLDILRRAADAGADWVDLEGSLSEESLRWFKASRARVLLSHHNFDSTPDRESLRSKAAELAKKHPDAMKIVTFAHEPQDNLRVLDLIPFCRNELGIDAIAFCMGPLGQWSRAASLLLGSPWTYVQFEGQQTAAPGQFEASEMRRLIEIIS